MPIDLFSIDTLIDTLARFGIRVKLVFKRSERSTQVACVVLPAAGACRR